MGRHSSWPVLIDELKCLSITDLKKWGYLRTGHRSGSVKWHFREKLTGSANIQLVMDENIGFGILDIFYQLADGTNARIPVKLAAMPANLGKGQRWYFICAYTGKRCTKLHYFNGRFQHRTGIPGSMYDTQTESKRKRLIRWLVDGCFALHEPDFFRCYRGVSTRKGKRLQKRRTGVMGWLRHTGEM
jgi:hypothetical protein